LYAILLARRDEYVSKAKEAKHQREMVHDPAEKDFWQRIAQTLRAWHAPDLKSSRQ
jgi:hypothetical protein